MMIDAVLSYHLNPQTCGVAKFNHALAKRLGVPHAQLPDSFADYSHPLVSIKTCEMQEPQRVWYDFLPSSRDFDLLLHDFPTHNPRFVRAAAKVFAANASLARQLRIIRSDVIEAFCPSTINGNSHRGKYNVLTFGMAHKLALEKFRELKQRLDVEHPDYTISLSTAVHEGNPWDTALSQSVDAMRGIFGDKLRVLGYLGDDALAKELQDCDAVAVYFDPAVRENNTTVWAALSAGKTVYTNTDEHSPELDPQKYSWDALTKLFA